MKLNVLELFSGSGTISKEFEKRGHNVFSIDIRKRRGVCEPSLRKDILEVTRDDIPFKDINIIWASPPCDVFSHSGLWYHWNKDGSPKTEKAKEHLKILDKTLKLIESLSPGYFFIENPRGKMRHNKDMINFLIRNNAMIKELTYSSYGSPIIKPTNIFTNALNYNPLPLGKFGRGAKNKIIFDNLTKTQRQKVPGTLAQEIVNYCEIEYKNKLLLTMVDNIARPKK